MLLQDVSLKRLMLAKRLIAGRVIAASVSLGALMDESMAFQSLTRGKAFTALLTDKFWGLEVCRVDVTVEVLLVRVGLIAAFVRTLEGALAGVTSHVGLEACLAVEHLATGGIWASKCLEVGGTLGAASGI